MNNVQNKKLTVGIYMVLSMVCFMVLTVLPAQAENPFTKDGVLDKVADDTFKTDIDPQTVLPATLGRIVFAFFSIIGLIFTCLIFYGGYRWMTARGNEQEVTNGKSVIRNAVIGLCITFASYSIWLFIQKFLL